jgi:hypothetical protein
MKSVIGSLLTTLLGTVMLVVGIAGVAGAFEQDEDSGSSSDSSSDVANFDSCSTADDRFGTFTTYEVTGPGGRATVIVSCQDGSVEVSMIGSGLTTEKRRTVSLWLYNNRRDAQLIAASQQERDEDAVALSGELPSGSEAYKKLVVTEGPGSDDFEDPEKPGKVILQVVL